MEARSWRGVIVGILIALALPILYAAIALLLSSGIVRFERTGVFFELLNSLTFNALAAFVLALLGIVMMFSAARIRSGLVILVLFAIALPVVAFVWFLSYATLGGAMGSPF
jgi:hypothetical protein